MSRASYRRGAVANELIAAGGTGAITQVGTWTTATTGTVGFDAATVAGQLLVLHLAVTRTSAVPACTTPAGWSLRASVDGINGTSHIKEFWYDRIADATATDTPTLSITGGSQRTHTARLTGQAASGYFDTAGTTNSNIVAGAQTFSDSAISPAAGNGLAFAAVTFRTSSQSVTSWGGGFASVLADVTNAGGGVATLTTVGGTPFTASVTVNNGGTTPIADLISVNYRAA